MDKLYCRRIKPKFGRWLPGYFFIYVKVIQNDQQSPYDFFLIFLANRFNRPYYRLLNTGKWSGGETRSQFQVWWKRAKLSGSGSSRSGSISRWGTEGVFSFLE